MSIIRNRSFFYGVILGFFAIYLGLRLEKFEIKDMVNLPAALIVFGGSLGATLIETDLTKLFQRRGSMRNLIFCSRSQAHYVPLIERLILWSETSRSYGILALEKHRGSVDHPLMSQALTMMVDGNNKQEVKEVIDDYYRMEKSYIQETESFYYSMGGYSPTFGILGAVIGLIHVLKNMAEPSLLGGGIAVAFVATAYGVFSANMVFLPLSMRARHQYEDLRLEIDIIERGLMMVIDGVNPKIIEQSLKNIYENSQ